jgi:hypothetical protein
MLSDRPRIVNRTNLSRLGLLLLIGAALFPSCASRYRVDLFLLQHDQRTKVKVEKTEYLIGTVLGDPLSQDKVVRGDGSCLAIVTGSRGRTLDTKAEDLVSFDRYDRYRIFLQLPSVPTPDTISLAGNSLVQLLGRYEVEVGNKVYFPIEGTVVVDSLSGRHLFGGIDGRFVNRLEDTIAFQGEFKVKIAE